MGQRKFTRRRQRGGFWPFDIGSWFGTKAEKAGTVPTGQQAQGQPIGQGTETGQQAPAGAPIGGKKSRKRRHRKLRKSRKGKQH